MLFFIKQAWRNIFRFLNKKKKEKKKKESFEYLSNPRSFEILKHTFKYRL